MTKSADAFRTISEVAEELDLHKHVLRFWEVKFPQIKPMKRGGGRRYYRPADLELLRGIRHLLHSEGYTIKGVQRIIRDKGIDAVKRVSGDAAPEASPSPDASAAAADIAEPSPAAAVRSRRGRQASRVAVRASASIPPASSTGNSAARSATATAAARAGAGAGGVSRGFDAESRQILLAALDELKSLRALLAGAPAAEATAAGGKARRAAG